MAWGEVTDGSWDLERGLKWISENERSLPAQLTTQKGAKAEGCATGLPRARHEKTLNSEIRTGVKEFLRWWSGSQLGCKTCSALNLQRCWKGNWGMKAACQAPTDGAEGDQWLNSNSVNCTEKRSHDCDWEMTDNNFLWLTTWCCFTFPGRLWHSAEGLSLLHCCCHLHHENFYKTAEILSHGRSHVSTAGDHSSSSRATFHIHIFIFNTISKKIFLEHV